MAIQVALNHKTEYRYDRSVALGPQIIRLRPAPHCRTPILSYSLKISPANHFINWQQDPQANYLARVVFPEKTTEFLVETNVVAEMAVYNPFDFFLEPSAEQYPFCYEPALLHELRPFLETEATVPELAVWLQSVSRAKVRTIDFLVALNQRLNDEIAKSPQSADVREALIVQGIEPIGNTPQEFATFLANERRRSTELVKIMGVRLD